jgi:hypothetical protein
VRRRSTLFYICLVVLAEPWALLDRRHELVRGNVRELDGARRDVRAVLGRCEEDGWVGSESADGEEGVEVCFYECWFASGRGDGNVGDARGAERVV